MINADEFVEAMQGLRPGIRDFFEALDFAMGRVDRLVSTTRQDVIYFGRVGSGTFYVEGDFNRTRWFPDTSPQEALEILAREFGDGWMNGLRPFG